MAEAPVEAWKHEVISRLTSLEDGWAGPHSKAVSQDVLNNLKALFAADNVPYDVAIVPNADGAIVIEWKVKHAYNMAIIDLDDKMYLLIDFLDFIGEKNEDSLREWEGSFDLVKLQNFLITDTFDK